MQIEMLEGRGVYAGGGDKNIWFCFLDMMRNKSSHSRNICQTKITPTLTKKRRGVRGEDNNQKKKGERENRMRLKSREIIIYEINRTRIG